MPGHDDSEAMKGLKFSGGDAPDYWDFMYFALVVGTTFQTSDTEVISRRMRRDGHGARIGFIRLQHGGHCPNRELGGAAHLSPPRAAYSAAGRCVPTPKRRAT